MERAQPDDLDRCQASVGKAQCPYKSVPGSSYCSNHSGGRQLIESEKRGFFLSQAPHLDAISRRAAGGADKTLDMEIAVLEELLRHKLERTQADQNKLVMETPQFQSLIRDLGVAKKTAQELERKSGEALTKPAIARLLSQVVTVFLQEIEDLPDYEERSDRIIGSISVMLGEARNSDNEDE